MYRNILERQWTGLVEDFVRENKDSVQTVQTYMDWYRANAYRFSSMNAIEGISLDQVNNPAFARALREKINGFHFAKVDAAPAADFKMTVAVSCAAAAAVILLLPLLPFLWTKVLWVRALLGSVAAAAAFLLQVQKAADAQQKDQERIFAEYADQLKNYLPELIAVCEQYKVA